MKPIIEFFYDVVSPYSYLAFENLCRLRDDWNFQLILKPFNLNAIMKATGNKPPASLPARAVFLEKDLARSSLELGIPLKLFPSTFPINSSLAMLTIAHVSLNFNPESDHVERVTRAIWKSYWGSGEDISDTRVLQKALKSVFPHEKDDYIAAIISTASQDAAAKDLLKRNTATALDAGSFGAPTILVSKDGYAKEFFFGSDRFNHIGQYLGLGKKFIHSKL